MKKILMTILVSSVLLNAQVIPGINSKSGAMTLPEGKLKIGIRHLYIKRGNMVDGTNKVTNNENLDATANITLLALRYGVSNNFDLRVAIPTASMFINEPLISTPAGPNLIELFK